MKSGIRILAIEDSPFDRKEKKSLLVGVIGRSGLIEGILSFKVSVDGDDSTSIIINSTKKSRFLDQIRLIAVNGNTVAGMNIIDLSKVSKRLKIPVIAITRTKPHPASFKLAIKKHMPDVYKKKAQIIDRLSKLSHATKIDGYYVQCIGIKPSEVSRLVEGSVKLLRLGHMIASAIARGESKGRL